VRAVISGAKGYYDAFFERLRACCPAMPLLVGLSLSEQCVASVPTEAHDVLLDAVVTPTGVLFGPSGELSQPRSFLIEK
jgi:5-formyltetrahydrofolate cyclo-ligase